MNNVNRANRLSPLKAIIAMSAILVGGGAVLLFSPVISAVVAPIFASFHLYHKTRANTLYKKTLDENKKREAFGRIEGQNYTFKSGKQESLFARDNGVQQLEHAKIHRRREEYRHFQQNSNFIKEITNQDRSSFTGDQDWKWLDKELRYRKAVIKEKRYAKWLKAILPGFIPVFGPIRAIFNWNNDNCSDQEHHKQYWSSVTAIDYHKRLIHKAKHEDLF